MACECYYGTCKYHDSQTDPDSGPFCHELECLATPEQIIVFQAFRRKELESIGWNVTLPPINLHSIGPAHQQNA